MNIVGQMKRTQQHQFYVDRVGFNGVKVNHAVA